MQVTWWELKLGLVIEILVHFILVILISFLGMDSGLDSRRFLHILEFRDFLLRLRCH